MYIDNRSGSFLSDSPVVRDNQFYGKSWVYGFIRQSSVTDCCYIAILIQKYLMAIFYLHFVPDITRVTNVPFWMRRQKSAYLTEYLNNYWTDLHQHFSFGSRMYGIIKLT